MLWKVLASTDLMATFLPAKVPHATRQNLFQHTDIFLDLILGDIASEASVNGLTAHSLICVCVVHVDKVRPQKKLTTNADLALYLVDLNNAAECVTTCGLNPMSCGLNPRQAAHCPT